MADPLELRWDTHRNGWFSPNGEAQGEDVRVFREEDVQPLLDALRALSKAGDGTTPLGVRNLARFVLAAWDDDKPSVQP